MGMTILGEYYSMYNILYFESRRQKKKNVKR